MEIDLLRAELEGDELLLDRAGLERDLYEAGVMLSGLWGETGLAYEGIEGSISTDPILPARDRLEEALDGHPDVAILDARGQLAEAERVQARSGRVPEMALSAGYLRNNELNESVVTAGLSFSLPILNRYKSAVLEKEHRRKALEHEARQIRLDRAAELASVYSQYEVRGRELDAISGEVLSHAMSIHRRLNEFYLLGKVGILDVLAARAHLLDLQMRIVNLSEQRAVLAADIQELTGYMVDVIK
jgi:cobalt-zinc-cadmium efflux system outer membrane protein